MKPRFLKLVSSLVLFVLMFTSVGIPLQSAAAQSFCDQAQFVTDVTVPDGTSFSAGAAFTKTWRLKNIGSCTWSTGYSLVFSSGEKMGGPDSIALPSSVAPGQTVDISVNLTAPASAGAYRGYWQLKNASGGLFGIGSTAAKAFWVSINVAGPVITGFDFTKDVCAAIWKYDGGPIPCPTNPNKVQYGYVTKLDNISLEDGRAANAPGLLTVPQNKYNGIIRGMYPIMDIFPHDRFQALIGCQANAVGCFVRFELEYMDNGNQITFWKFDEKFDGLNYPVDVDLTPIAWKKNIRLILKVSAYGPATGDMPVWIAPRIVRQVDTIPMTSTPSPFTPTPGPTSEVSCKDRASFVADVTVPDGTTFVPGAAFVKTWRLSNSGTCPWTTGYKLVFSTGNKMGGPEFVQFTNAVPQGQLIDLSVNLIAPPTAGSYRGYWMLKNEKGKLFGLSPQADDPFYVDIKVAGTPVTVAPTATLAPLTPVVVPSSTNTPVPTPTNTPVPSSDGWSAYQNTKYGFAFRFPPGSSVATWSDNKARIYLPYTAGTNLIEKYVNINVADGVNPCHDTDLGGPIESTSNVTINGINFLLEAGSSGAAGSVYDWKSYSAFHGNGCVTLTFVLHSANLGNYPVPPPAFDKAAESAVFDVIMSKFGWIP